MLDVYETAQQWQTPLQALGVVYIDVYRTQPTTTQWQSTLFSFERKMFLWDTDLGPSLPSKLTAVPCMSSQFWTACHAQIQSFASSVHHSPTSTAGLCTSVCLAIAKIVTSKHQRSLLDFIQPSSSTSSAHIAKATDSDPENEVASQSKHRVSGHIYTVQVHWTQGGTTIKINNFSASGGCSNINSSPNPTEPEQSQTTHAENTVVAEIPSDVAATPDQQPHQPKLSHFPVTLMGGKQRVFLC